MAGTTGAEFVAIGEVGKPHGIKGELSLTLRVDDPQALCRVETLFLRPKALSLPARSGPPGERDGKRPRSPGASQPSGLVPYRVLSLRAHQSHALVRVAGIEDRNQAESLRGAVVHIRACDLAEPDPDMGDALFLFQLVGLCVELEDGAVLGTIQSVMTPGMDQEIWVIATADGKEILFPAQPEFVLSIDVEAGCARVDPPPGLLELYLE